MKSTVLVAFALALLFSISPLRAETVSGSVVGPDGKPLETTVFYVGDGRWTTSTKEVQSTSSGAFSFELEPVPAKPNSGVSLVARDPASRGSVAAYAPGLSLGAALLKADGDNVLKLQPSRKVSGVLRDDTGAPVAGANLRIRHFFQRFGPLTDRNHVFFLIPESLQQQFSANTAADGSWEIAGVAPQTAVNIELDDENYVRDSMQHDPESAMPGFGNRELIARRAGKISGRVLDAKGLPAADVPVIAVPIPTQPNSNRMGGIGTTGSDGTFRINSVHPGTYYLMINTVQPRLFSPAMPVSTPITYAAPAIENVRVEVGKASSNHKLQLVQPAKVSGRVIDRATGKPLSGAVVGAYGKGAPRAIGLWPSTRTDSQGRYELNLVPGDNALYAYEAAIGGNDKPKEPTSVPARLAPGENKTTSLFIDRRFADVQGQVVEENGRPLAGVEMTLWNESGTGQTLRSDEQGNFLVERLQRGAVRLDPRAEWTVVSPKNLTLPMAKGSQLKIVVRRNVMAQVTGRVVDTVGNPVAGVELRYSMPFLRDDLKNARSILHAVSDEQGVYELGNLKMPEALKLTMDNLDKKGYRLREGGIVPPEAVAKEGALQLTDVVLEHLGRELTGIVHGRDGKAIEGAQVRSSGDDYVGTAATDATGRFILGGQPEGEVELLAAHNRDFGRATSANGEAKIVLQPGAEPPPQDIARAVELFREMAPAADESTLITVAIELAPHDPAAALELLLFEPGTEPDPARLRVLGALRPGSSDEILSWAQGELENIQGDEPFVHASAIVGLLLSSRQPEGAEAIFERANARLAQVPADKRFLATARVAALAARLKLPETETLLEAVLAEQNRRKGNPSVVATALAMGTAELAEQLLDSMPPGQERDIYAYRLAIKQVARYDVPGAIRLLEKMRVLVDAVPELPDENDQLRGRASWEFEWAFAAKDVMRANDFTDAAMAANIARRVRGWHRPSALALAAEFGNRQQALALVRETIAAEDRGDWMENVTVPRLGALVAEFDPAVATELFSTAATSLETQRRQTDYTNYTNWGFYAAFWNPAPARLALEADWQREQQRVRNPEEEKHNMAEWNKAAFAMAMSAVDVERALEWARQTSNETATGKLSPRSRALAFIGRLLLTEPAERRLMVIASESGYDS